jgi:hypothetical protein
MSEGWLTCFSSRRLVLRLPPQNASSNCTQREHRILTEDKQERFQSHEDREVQKLVRRIEKKHLKKPPEKPKRTEHSETIEKKWAAEHFDVEPTAPLRAVEFTLYGFATPCVRSAVKRRRGCLYCVANTGLKGFQL